ncbi:hypothetical protein GWK47_034945 [Chionoecetes opilio]|uniref:Uncharacterized protein n=1 Tax=Chionoecetes opilio TaxID=41210 RepID=A0A8J4YHD9_CHIOP|nr:hypothetical protein GWK47_034945 [Chionoecetes opilio]
MRRTKLHLQLFTQDIEESGTEQEDQRKRQEGTRQLKAMLWHLEKFFVFDSYVRTENDTLEGKSVHTGRARCQQKTCQSKGKAATYTYTTRSKVNLKKHYEKVSKKLRGRHLAAEEVQPQQHKL